MSTKGKKERVYGKEEENGRLEIKIPASLQVYLCLCIIILYCCNIPFFLNTHPIGSVGSSSVNIPRAPYRIMSSLRYWTLR